MYRTSLARITTGLLPTSLTTTTRVAAASFSTSLRSMAEGDTGATRAGGTASGDAFTQREQANENYTIQQREKEKFAALQAQVKKQQEDLQKLSDDLSSMDKKQGNDKK